MILDGHSIQIWPRSAILCTRISMPPKGASHNCFTTFGTYLIAALLATIAASCSPTSSLQRTVSAFGETRPLEARLAGVRIHRPFGTRPGGTPPPEAFEFAAAAARSANASRDVASLRMLAAAELLTGRARASTAVLTDAVGSAPDRWDLQNDLAAAYATVASQSAEGEATAFWARALESAIIATELAPNQPEAWFNRAVTLQRLELRREARLAWQRYLSVERMPAWLDEGRQRLAEVSAEPIRPEDAARRSLADPKTSPADTVYAAIARAPEAARTAFERDLLPEWARAAEAGDQKRAALWLDRANRLAETIQTETSDRLPADAIDTILAAIRQRDQRRIALLARGHRDFAEALDAFEENRRESAAQALARASQMLGDAKSPFASSALAQEGIVLYGLRRFDEAEVRATRATELANRRGYASVLGHAAWVRGVVRTEHGDFETAIPAFESSIRFFEEAAEPTSAAFTANTAAYALRIVGEHERGWSFLDRAYRQIRSLSPPRRRQVVLLNASLYASDEERFRAALVFENASMDVAQSRGADNAVVEAYIRRAVLHLRLKHRREAVDDLASAERLLPDVRSPASRSYLKAWLTGVRADTTESPQLRHAVELYDWAIAAFRTLEPAQVAHLYLQRGRAALNGGDRYDAERSFDAGIAEIEARRDQLTTTQYRLSYLDESWSVFEEMIRLHAADNDSQRAFAFAERGRSRPLQRASRRVPATATLQGIGRLIPPSAALVYYASVTDRLLMWVWSHDRVDFLQRQVTAAQLGSLVTTYRTLLESHQEGPEVRRVAERLFDTLVAPASDLLRGTDQVVFIPDGSLQALPFATLVDPRTHRYLVEDRSVGVLPSATLLETALARLAALPSGAARDTRALLIGSPWAPSETGLPYLPDVQHEIEDIARIYPTSTVISGSAATITRVTALAPDFDVVHFAGHARINASFPERSNLILAPDPARDTGVLSAGDIATWELPHVRLLVLSACETAFGGTYRGEGVASLAREFLAAGVPSVVGTLWNVDDRIARAVLTRFHEEFLASNAPLDALRRAQLAQLHSNTGADGSVYSWGGFVAISPFDARRAKVF